MNIRELAWNMLPGFLKKIRHTWVLGKIGQYSEDDNFLYDYRILSRLYMNSYSQHGQDAFVFYLLFGGKKEGVFLDIGANDPIAISNTLLLEENGWSGYAFEPIKRLADKWSESRKTPCYNIALGAEKKKVLFSESQLDYLSGIGVTDMVESQYEIQQDTVTSFLVDKGINKIDVAFIDVEGYEMEVLKGIDFEKLDIKCFCIENNRKSEIIPDKTMRKFLIDRGYKLIARLTIDDVFVKSDLIK
jgi:FkbM family methyltransferase